MIYLFAIIFFALSAPFISANLIRESVYLIVKMVDATLKMVDATLKLINSTPKCTLKLLDSILNSLKSRDIIIR